MEYEQACRMLGYTPVGADDRLPTMTASEVREYWTRLDAAHRAHARKGYLLSCAGLGTGALAFTAGLPILGGAAGAAAIGLLWERRSVRRQHARWEHRFRADWARDPKYATLVHLDAILRDDFI